ncbi:MAG: hypothetical protein AD742_14650 [Methylibium sp. NZG]|nr:MAG: hypothetical protein AD742_14650 [Methylibium sp. NZG]
MRLLPMRSGAARADTDRADADQRRMRDPPTPRPEATAMNPLRSLRALPSPQRELLLVAAITAVALLSLYVQLLHASLERGHDLREQQRLAGPTKPGKSASTVTASVPSPRSPSQRSGPASEPAKAAAAGAR